jgi:hypothetical protein
MVSPSIVQNHVAFKLHFPIDCFLPLRGEEQDLMNENIALGMDISQGNLNQTI